MNSKESGRTMNLDEDQGTILLKLARQTLAGTFGRVPPPGTGVGPGDLSHPAFQSRRGTFVTLKIDGQLRGCIGSLVASETIVEGVRRNALNAAFHDPRFPPLTADELHCVMIEVSILTAPERLAHSGGGDLLKKLRPHVDGVIVRKGYLSATFLPQVWEQLPDPTGFLTHLCLKAGLPAAAWKERELEVQTYQVRYFEERPE